MNRYINKNKGRDNTIEPAYFAGLREVGSGSSGSNIRYTLEKRLEDGVVTYVLKEVESGQEVGDKIVLNSTDINVKGETLDDVIGTLTEKIDQAYKINTYADEETIRFG